MECKCIYCGEIIPEEVCICQRCGKNNSAESFRTPLPVIAEAWLAPFHEHIFCCPRCGDNFNGNEYEMDYCWSCGQALDWSDEAKEKAIKEYEERKKNDI